MSYSWVKYCIVALNGVIQMVYNNLYWLRNIFKSLVTMKTNSAKPALFFYLFATYRNYISQRYRLNNFFLHILTIKLKEILIYPFLSRALYFVRVTEINSIWLEFAVVNLYCCWASNFNLNDSGIDGGGGRGSLKTTYIDWNENKFSIEK